MQYIFNLNELFQCLNVGFGFPLQVPSILFTEISNGGGSSDIPVGGDISIPSSSITGGSDASSGDSSSDGDDDDKNKNKKSNKREAPEFYPDHSKKSRLDEMDKKIDSVAKNQEDIKKLLDYIATEAANIRAQTTNIETIAIHTAEGAEYVEDQTGRIAHKVETISKDNEKSKASINNLSTKIENVKNNQNNNSINSNNNHSSHASRDHSQNQGEKGNDDDEDEGGDDFGTRSPLDQFLIKDLVILILPLIANTFVSYTNMALYLTIAFLLVIFIYVLCINFKKLKTSNWYLSIESMYATIHSIVVNQINTKKGQSFFPLMYYLFIFILVNNLIGMVPYSFAPTSHFILTFFLSFTIVFGATILGFILHKLVFFSLLVPGGCPLGLLPLLVLIETISYIARNISLGLRLAANILSGHMLLNILSEFTYKIMDTNIIYLFVGIIPLIFIQAFSSLELGIAFIQAQVFVVLSSSYTKDSIDLH